MLGRERRGRLRGVRRRAREDVNPMNHMSNLVDAMLVLAVGIMLALVVSWNLQISSEGKITADSDQAAVSSQDAVSSFTDDDMTPADEKEISDTENLEEAGVVYRDKATGKYYVIKADGTKETLKQN